MESPDLTLHRACRDISALLREHVQASIPYGEVVRFALGEAIWRPADTADSVFLLEAGIAEVQRGRARARVLLHRVTAGEAFGELCVCRQADGRRGSLAVAVEPCRAVRIGLGDFLTAVQRSRPLLNAIVGTMCDRLVDAEVRAEVLAERDAERRIASLLLHLAHKEGGARGEQRPLYLTHAQIARMAAMSRSHTTVVLGRLRERGVIDYAASRAVRVDPDALERLLGNPEAD
jgi:CRP-like cAMP-binding protein